MKTFKNDSIDDNNAPSSGQTKWNNLILQQIKYFYKVKVKLVKKGF